MRWWRFLPANASGSVVWAAIYTTAVYLAGNTLRRVSATIDLVIGAVAVIAIVTVLVFVRRQVGTLAERAEAAYPGPLE